jgi:hypothetical protein
MIASNQNASKNRSSNNYLSKLAKKTFKENVNVDKISSISFWSLAEGCINGINNITGSNMKFNQKLDKTGKTEEIQLKTKYFAFSTPIKK